MYTFSLNSLNREKSVLWISGRSGELWVTGCGVVQLTCGGGLDPAE